MFGWIHKSFVCEWMCFHLKLICCLARQSNMLLCSENDHNFDWQWWCLQVENKLLFYSHQLFSLPVCFQGKLNTDCTDQSIMETSSLCASMNLCFLQWSTNIVAAHALILLETGDISNIFIVFIYFLVSNPSVHLLVIYLDHDKVTKLLQCSV